MVHGERFNAITHIIGSVLAIVGTSVVVTLASLSGGARRITAVAVYGAMPVVLYVAMGWLVVVAFNPLTRALPRPGIALLLAGGIIYTIGIFFFAMSKRIPHSHGVWHLFVLAGSAVHYVAVVRYVAMP